MRHRLLTLTLIFFLLLPAAAHAKSVAYNKAAIREVAKSKGYGPVQTRALLRLAYRESRYHNNSINWSPVPKYRCYGLFQLSRSMCLGKPWRSPRWNTRRAIRYIKHRYGTPTRALAHSYRTGWY